MAARQQAELSALACFGDRRTTVVHFGTSTSCRVDADGVETGLAASIGHCDPSSEIESSTTAQEISSPLTSSCLSVTATTGGSVPTTDTGTADG